MNAHIIVEGTMSLRISGLMAYGVTLSCLMMMTNHATETASVLLGQNIAAPTHLLMQAYVPFLHSLYFGKALSILHPY